jgi:ATP-dependent Clp protease ATP-binding subunit ClpB
LNELSKQILSGKIQKDAVIMMELNEEGEVVFENISEEKIEV